MTSNPFAHHTAALPAELAAVDNEQGVTAGEYFDVERLAAADWNGDGKPRDGREPADLRHNNTRFAGFGVAALAAYAERVGGIDGEPAEQVIRDLLADLRHLADALGEDFDYLAERAEERYREEVTGDL